MHTQNVEASNLVTFSRRPPPNYFNRVITVVNHIHEPNSPLLISPKDGSHSKERGTASNVYFKFFVSFYSMNFSTSQFKQNIYTANTNTQPAHKHNLRQQNRNSCENSTSVCTTSAKISRSRKAVRNDKRKNHESHWM